MQSYWEERKELEGRPGWGGVVNSFWVPKGQPPRNQSEREKDLACQVRDLVFPQDAETPFLKGQQRPTPERGGWKIQGSEGSIQNRL